MKISTKLGLAVGVPLIMALVVAVVLAVSYQSMVAAQRNGDIVRQLRTDVTNLNGFVNSYLLYHEERPKQQFSAEHDLAIQLIDKANFQSPEQQQLMENIRQGIESMNQTFLSLVSNYEQTQSSGSSALGSQAEQRLVGQLLIQSQDTDSNASLLRSLVDAGINQLELRTIGLVALVLVLATLPLTFVMVRTRRSIISSLSKLNQGAAVIGSGNLDFRIEEKTKDEIGDLSRAFNRMTSDLKAVTASKTDLEKEMVKRLEVEEELQVSNEHLQNQTQRLEEEIDERKRVEEELKRYAANLEIVNKELEAFSYTVSHDLRAPLRSLDGFSEMMLEDYGDKLDQPGKDYLNRIRKASQTMAQLIDDILNLSRISRAEMHQEKVDLTDLSQSIAEGLKFSQPERQAEFVIEPDLNVKGDMALLRVALNNLLENAWKYTGKCPVARIEVGSLGQKNARVYFIKDNGVGFDMQYKDKLFQPFQRLHTGNEYPGTGIGLATVQRVVRRHNGRIWAESEIGKGSTFYFTLE